MPKVKVTFERRAIVWYIGSVEVEVTDPMDASDAAEDMLMQGLVEFSPDPAELAEFDGPATIKSEEQVS